jgi:hypothetical protein
MGFVWLYLLIGMLMSFWHNDGALPVVNYMPKEVDKIYNTIFGAGIIFLWPLYLYMLYLIYKDSNDKFKDF